MLKALKGLGLPDALLQQVHQSLAPPQKLAASKLRQLAHLDEQLKALKNRIQRHTLAVERHREQGERMQEKLLNMHVEEDKLNLALLLRLWKIPLDLSPLIDDGVGVSFVENEDSSKRARVDPAAPPPVPPAPHATTIAMTKKALGDRQLSRKKLSSFVSSWISLLKRIPMRRKRMCCFSNLKRNMKSCRCFSDRGNEGWHIATMKGSCKARFQKSRSTAFGKRKVFNTRF